MFATQLLRILQTVTTDVKHDTCVYDSPPRDMIMKENQIVTTHIKEVNHLTGLRRDSHPWHFETKGTEEFQNRPLHRPENLDDGDDPLSSNTNAKDEAHDPPIADGDFVHRSENECLDLFEREKLFSDKNVLEYEHPELIVCCKEINYHVVKDICVDEGEPASRKILIDSSKDANGAIDEDTTEFIIANQQRSKNESNVTKLVTQNSPKLISENSRYENTPASDEESFVDRVLPVQEFGTRSFLRSFINSLDQEGDSQASILCYNSEVETRSITFDFTRGAKDMSNKSINIVNEPQNVGSNLHNNNPVVSLRRYDEGESSFSVDDFITHSGPITFSGSISLRSDGSATSGKSFAFPILQAEWSSSPVRMTEGDRRRFRKHRGWRSGLLCCRF